MNDLRTKSFRDLVVWQRAHQLVSEIYQISAVFPNEEKFGLTSQLRRAVASIPANIDEGYRRLSHSEQIRFYNIAQASLDEAQYFMIPARDLKYTGEIDSDQLFDEVAGLLASYIRKIAQNSPKE